MKLYLITAPTSGWDVFDSAVVAAKSPKDARKIHPGGHHLDGNWGPGFSGSDWVSPDDVTAIYLGEAKPKTERGVICASYNAG